MRVQLEAGVADIIFFTNAELILLASLFTFVCLSTTTAFIERKIYLWQFTLWAISYLSRKIEKKASTFCMRKIKIISKVDTDSIRIHLTGLVKSLYFLIKAPINITAKRAMSYGTLNTQNAKKQRIIKKRKKLR